jgi:hypothetical protein
MEDNNGASQIVKPRNTNVNWVVIFALVAAVCYLLITKEKDSKKQSTNKQPVHDASSQETISTVSKPDWVNHLVSTPILLGWKEQVPLNGIRYGTTKIIFSDIREATMKGKDVSIFDFTLEVLIKQSDMGDATENIIMKGKDVDGFAFDAYGGRETGGQGLAPGDKAKGTFTVEMKLNRIKKLILSYRYRLDDYTSYSSKHLIERELVGMKYP